MSDSENRPQDLGDPAADLAAMPDDEQARAEQLDDERLPDEFPPDRPYAAEMHGTTAAEEAEGPSLDQRLAAEHRRGDERDDAEVQLLGEDAGVRDREAELWAEEAEEDGDEVLPTEPASAEEAAVHIRRNP